MDNLHSSYLKGLRSSSPPLTELQCTLSNVPHDNVLILGLQRQSLSQEASANYYSYKSKTISWLLFDTKLFVTHHFAQEDSNIHLIF